MELPQAIFIEFNFMSVGLLLLYFSLFICLYYSWLIEELKKDKYLQFTIFGKTK